MNLKRIVIAALLFCTLFSSAFAISNPFQRKHKRSGEENVRLTIARMKEVDPDVSDIFKRAVAWAVFPTIGKVGIGIGGAAGNGRVYYKNSFIGTTTMSQISVGFQLGGQEYSEIIFFQDDATLKKFQAGKLEFGANVSIVALKAGAAKTAGFKDGTIVITLPKRGLMYEASVSGQKFTFKAAKRTKK